MNNMGTISVGTIDNLQHNDLFAYEFIGGVQSGRVLSVVHYVFQLTPEMREYLGKKQYIEIPENENETIGGASEALVFYHDGEKETHMFVDTRMMVAIFPNPRGQNAERLANKCDWEKCPGEHTNKNQYCSSTRRMESGE